MKEKDPKKIDNELNRWKNLCEHLLGPIDEIDLEEADQLLAAAEIDTEILKGSMYTRLSKQARSLRARGEALPALLEEALEDLRPEWAPARNEEELRKQARSKLAAIRKPTMSLPVTMHLSFAYRNKRDLSEPDKQFLDRIAKKLEERTKHSGEKE